MEGNTLGVIVTLSLGLGILAGILVRGQVQEHLESRRRERDLQRLFEQTNRQKQLERLNARRELYAGFRNAAAGLVEELAAGAGRWASFYVTRDLLWEVNMKAPADVALAARQMCHVCQLMLNEGYSDAQAVRFTQALQRFDEACREGLTHDFSVGSVAADSPAAAPPQQAALPARRYFRVLR